MNIPEIKKTKSQLEKTICKLINDFEDNTNIKITHISVDRVSWLGISDSRYNKVEIDVEIE